MASRAPRSSVVRGVGPALAAAFALATVACDDPGATLAITDARASRDPARNVVVEVDLLARERLGGNIGVYCLRVAFVEGSDVREECYADLEDGDTKTARFVGGDLPPGAVIHVRSRLVAADDRRDVVAPP